MMSVTILAFPNRMKPRPVLTPVRDVDRLYWELHAKCSDGTITADERVQLSAMCVAKEEAYELEQVALAAAMMGEGQ